VRARQRARWAPASAAPPGRRRCRCARARPKQYLRQRLLQPPQLLLRRRRRRRVVVVARRARLRAHTARADTLRRVAHADALLQRLDLLRRARHCPRAPPRHARAVPPAPCRGPLPGAGAASAARRGAARSVLCLRVSLWVGEGRGVSDWYGVRDAACPLSTGKGSRRGGRSVLCLRVSSRSALVALSSAATASRAARSRRSAASCASCRPAPLPLLFRNRRRYSSVTAAVTLP